MYAVLLFAFPLLFVLATAQANLRDRFSFTQYFEVSYYSYTRLGIIIFILVLLCNGLYIALNVVWYSTKNKYIHFMTVMSDMTHGISILLLFVLFCLRVLQLSRINISFRQVLNNAYNCKQIFIYGFIVLVVLDEFLLLYYWLVFVSFTLLIYRMCNISGVWCVFTYKLKQLDEVTKERLVLLLLSYMCRHHKQESIVCVGIGDILVPNDDSHDDDSNMALSLCAISEIQDGNN
ncbi:hypothetical protein RFI_06446 [Reticulomyxa filosa]|uniref:Uncharacterized protein n=1 Tax=Reticulomyxa filosa TaxID=46433 RepID=X6NWI6_RETFI|nr:hypothetical protein RFI_06446 [Reticulomyxa filosa]|eukprot:ETO30675.1 hypothetical protein RFI_06446 [Reticulomyxa filosa]